MSLFVVGNEYTPLIYTYWYTPSLHDALPFSFFLRSSRKPLQNEASKPLMELRSELEFMSTVKCSDLSTAPPCEPLRTLFGITKESIFHNVHREVINSLCNMKLPSMTDTARMKTTFKLTSTILDQSLVQVSHCNFEFIPYFSLTLMHVHNQDWRTAVENDPICYHLEQKNLSKDKRAGAWTSKPQTRTQCFLLSSQEDAVIAFEVSLRIFEAVSSVMWVFQR